MLGYNLLAFCCVLLINPSEGRYCGEKLMQKMNTLCTKQLDCINVEPDLRQPSMFLRWCCSQSTCTELDLKKFCCGLVLKAKLSLNQT
ncbi:unnamed protein product [Bursaphelenchus okinawaensis]|uniref:Uncharacterized protein n=1 Tax=Bursaphelenchus okinawaensis TaxID=465554 RepID=A0A811LE05_9BILA|nr:unnamed protein product [Bursaphelenchus okinawaensis]CAG9120673.1 unnamed protein product [Bursaphelenchus okinawaensis]